MILVCSKNVTEETDRLKVVKGYTKNQVLEAIYLHAATCLYLAQAYMTKLQNVIGICDPILETRLIAQKLKFELLVPLNSSIFAEQNGGQDAVIACTVAEL